MRTRRKRRSDSCSHYAAPFVIAGVIAASRAGIMFAGVRIGSDEVCLTDIIACSTRYITAARFLGSFPANRSS